MSYSNNNNNNYTNSNDYEDISIKSAAAGNGIEPKATKTFTVKK